MNELASWDAVETEEHLRNRDVSVPEVVEAAITRARAHESLGALITATFERALEHAKKFEGKALSDAAFSGVPSAVKDLANVAGVPTSFGSRAAGPTPPKKNDPFVNAFEQMGFVSLGKSATPELGLTASTEPMGFPPCRNPWDPMRTPGGSSGGAASLVGSGVLPLAHASDGGGSIRIPAACCGVVGLKPTRGRFDMEASRLLPVNIATHGCVSRSVRDTVTFWDALTRIESTDLPSMIPLTPEPAAPLKIGLYTDRPDGLPIDPEFKQATLDAAKLCESLGHHVEPIGSPVRFEFVDDFIRYWSFVAWAQSGTMKALAHREFDKKKIDPWTAGLSKSFAADKFKGAQATWRLMTRQQEFLSQFERFDVLLTPTIARPPPQIGELSPELDFETKLKRLLEFVPFTPPYNVTGAPAISLPLYRTEAGLPIGIQFGAKRGNERVLLELALQLEAAKPWPRAAQVKLPLA